MKKSSFLLVEVIISVALFAVLLTALFGLFYDYNLTTQTMKKKRNELEAHVLTQIRLQKILSRTVFEKKYRPYFYLDTSDPQRHALIFTFENEAMIDEDFSEIVLAKLYVDKNALTLTLWPHKKDKTKEIPTKVQKEILLQDVTELKIALFKPEDKPGGKKETKKSDQEHPHYGIWTSEWIADFEERATLVHLTCNKGEFWFIIPQEVSTVNMNL